MPSSSISASTAHPSGLTGDVRSTELDGITGRITPVPGGVGPLTIAMRVVNTLRAARWRAQHEAVAV